MTPDELNDAHTKAMMLIRLLMTTITHEELSGLQAEFSRMHALMPITDPTAYKRIVGNMGGHEDAIRALARCRGELEQIIGPELASVFE